MSTLKSARSRRFVRRASPMPVYRQLADQLESEIVDRRRDQSTFALPSESELADEFGISRITVRQALERLQSKGLIYRERGRGSYVRSCHVEGISGFGSFTEEVRRAGSRPGSCVVATETVSSLPAEMLRYVVPPPPSDSASGYFALQRVRMIDDVPVAYEEAYLPIERFPGIEDASFDDLSLYEVMRDHWGFEPSWADAAIEPSSADEQLSKLLDIERGAPVITAWRVTSTELDEVLEYVRSVYRGDGFTLTVKRHKLG